MRKRKVLLPGLYESNSHYKNMIMSWKKILANGFLRVENGVLYSTADLIKRTNDNANKFAGDLIVSSEVIKIAERAFFSYSSLTGILIPNSVNEIDKYAFSCCEKLKKAVLPSKINKIAEGTFVECVSLEVINIPYRVKKIEKEAFYHCENLPRMDIYGDVNYS